MFEEQLAAFIKFSKLKVGALFMQMGTGKTKVALELVNYNQVDLLLYFSPFSALSNIQTEIEKWGLNCEHKLIGFETLSSSDRVYLEILDLIKDKKVFVIADESIFIKNPETNRYKRLMSIRNLCEYALILNGTPITKNEWDLYYQFQFLSPLIFNMSESQFRNTFFDKVTYKKRYEKPKTFFKMSEVNADALQKIIEPYSFNADLDFKLKETESFNNISVPLDNYNEHKLSELEKMRNNYSLEKIMALLSKLNFLSAIESEKNNQVASYSTRKQVIIYCNYLEEVRYLQSKMECYVITGATPRKERAEIIEQFKENSLPLVMTFGVGSYSLNLQFCNEIVYSSINFDYAKIEQSKYRIKRIGQTRDIKYTYFLSECGINRMIQQNLSQKKDMDKLIKEKIEKGDVEWLSTI